MSRKILFVDDDPNLLAAFQRNLRRQFDFDVALGGEEALRLLRTAGPYALILADMNMPGMSGVELLEQARVEAPSTVRLMLTGNADQQTAVEAVNRGAISRFLTKPCPPDALVAALEAGLRQYDRQEVERELLEGTLTATVRLLSEVLGMVAPEALGRGQRLRDSMSAFARFINAAPVWELEVAALLSGIGCAALPGRVLEKIRPGEERTEAEERLVRGVAQTGHDLLVAIPRFEGVAKIVLYQHKCYDGTGVPATACAGREIPLGARMLKILGDRLALEAEGVAKGHALQAMRQRAGAYDPDLLERCFAFAEDYLVQSISGARPVRSLTVGELRAGQIVVSDITTKPGLLLLGSANRITPMILQRLKNFDALGELKSPVLVQDGPD